jgi:enterochelin esterase family protein
VKTFFALFLTLTTWVTAAQDYSSFTKTIQTFYSSPTDADRIWNALVAAGKIPLTVEDSVAFLYRGEATSVMWVGDFNGWGSDKTFKNNGTRIPNTNLWILKCSFPLDARLDYKIVVNQSSWILDPANPFQQFTGLGGGSPNSELRMTQWRPDTITEPMLAISHGKLIRDILIESNYLGYQVMYSLYLPADFKPTSTDVYPILYVTDGYEYLHEKMGNITTILDNLIHLRKIKPIIAVFIDHREPINRSNDRRMNELAMNANFFDFITKELLPVVESKYPISTHAEDRAILGTSLGGLTSAYFAYSKPEIFGLAGIQSPAFWFKPEIYSICDNPGRPPVRTFLTTGTFHDALEGATRMKAVFDKNGCTYQYREVHQGHSWGNWRDLTDDMLIYFFAPN